MYTPIIRTKQNQLPILKREEIDDIAEQFLMHFQPEALKNPMEVDVDGFLERYLGATPDYQYLSHNIIYLGMTVFQDTNSIPVYDPYHNRAEYFSAKANTVIFDTRLVEEANQEHRYRFTAGHECGHLVFHTPYFERQALMRKLLGVKNEMVMQCLRMDLPSSKKRELKTDNDWMEWQANQFSGSFLMPKSAVLSILDDYGTSSIDIFNSISAMATIFNVSHEAVMNRLRNLGFIRKTETISLDDIMAD